MQRATTAMALEPIAVVLGPNAVALDASDTALPSRLSASTGYG